MTNQKENQEKIQEFRNAFEIYAAVAAQTAIDAAAGLERVQLYYNLDYSILYPYAWDTINPDQRRWDEACTEICKELLIPGYNKPNLVFTSPSFYEVLDSIDRYLIRNESTLRRATEIVKAAKVGLHEIERRGFLSANNVCKQVPKSWQQSKTLLRYKHYLFTSSPVSPHIRVLNMCDFPCRKDTNVLKILQTHGQR